MGDSDPSQSTAVPAEQPRKRVRRSGWDVQTPVAPQSQAAQVAPVLPGVSGIPPPPSLALPVPGAGTVAVAAAPQPSMDIQKTLAEKLSSLNSQLQLPKPGCRIYIGSIHYDLKEADIITLFSTFGTVTKSEMQIDPMTGKSKGFCFLEFTEQASADAAMAMDGFELAGRKIKVGRPHHGQGSMQHAQAQNLLLGGGGAVAAAAGVNPLLAQLNMSAGLGLGLGLGGLPVGLPAAAAPTTAGAPAPVPSAVAAAVAAAADAAKLTCVLVRNIVKAIQLPEVEAIFAAFGPVLQCQQCAAAEADRVAASSGAVAAVAAAGGGDAAAVYAIVVEYAESGVATATATSMQDFDLASHKLQCQVISKAKFNQLLSAGSSSSSSSSNTTSSSTDAPVTAGGNGAGAASAADVNSISTQVLLENMITMEDVKDPDLKDEIGEEAETYGQLTNVEILVDDSRQTANVKLTYATAVDASKAWKAMNGRVFAGNKIIASLVPPAD
mmetsp:Transcript_19647/g.33371  ORF Transcript_19647/g.33371 Transcript_19647/m.33371 type:complete len:496 (+) Transcript_19647:36-1523(+)